MYETGYLGIYLLKDEFTQAELRRQEEEAKKLGLLGQNPDGGADKEGDFMSEAKDWAGELISGQTGTGRILVRKNIKGRFIWNAEISVSVAIHCYECLF